MARTTKRARVRAVPQRPRDIVLGARRRHRKRIGRAVLLGLAVSAFTLGALGERAPEWAADDPLPAGLVAALLGIAFTIGSLPVGWSIVGAIVLPVPAAFVFLTVFLERQPPLPFYAAFTLSLGYAAVLTVLARTLSERPGRFLLGTRAAKPPDPGAATAGDASP